MLSKQPRFTIRFFPGGGLSGYRVQENEDYFFSAAQLTRSLTARIRLEEAQQILDELTQECDARERRGRPTLNSNNARKG